MVFLRWKIEVNSAKGIVHNGVRVMGKNDRSCDVNGRSGKEPSAYGREETVECWGTFDVFESIWASASFRNAKDLLRGGGQEGRANEWA